MFSNYLGYKTKETQQEKQLQKCYPVNGMLDFSFVYNTAIVIMYGMGSDHDFWKMDDHHNILVETVSYETQGFFSDLENLKKTVNTLSKTESGPNDVFSQMRIIKLKNVLQKCLLLFSRVIAIGVSHGSLVLQGAVMKLQMDNIDISKMCVYTIGSPRYLPRYLMSFNPTMFHRVLNFFHLNDLVISKLLILVKYNNSFKIPNFKTYASAIEKGLGVMNLPDGTILDNKENKYGYYYDEENAVVINNIPYYPDLTFSDKFLVLPFINNAFNYHVSSISLYPVFDQYCRYMFFTDEKIKNYFRYIYTSPETLYSKCLSLKKLRLTVSKAQYNTSYSLDNISFNVSSMLNTAIVIMEGVLTNTDFCKVLHTQKCVIEWVNYLTKNNKVSDIYNMNDTAKALALENAGPSDTYSEARILKLKNVLKKYTESHSNVIAIGISYGSLLMQGAIMKLKMENCDMKNLNVYTIGSPRCIPKDFIGLSRVGQVLNFYHLNDPFITSLYKLTQNGDNSFIIPNLQYIRDNKIVEILGIGPSSDRYFYDKEKSIVIGNMKNTIQGLAFWQKFTPYLRDTILYHTSPSTLFPIFDQKLMQACSTLQVDAVFTQQCNEQSAGLSKYVYIKMCSTCKNYKVHIDNNTQKYIKQNKQKIFLRELRGKYRYVSI